MLQRSVTINGIPRFNNVLHTRVRWITNEPCHCYDKALALLRNGLARLSSFGYRDCVELALERSGEKVWLPHLLDL